MTIKVKGMIVNDDEALICRDWLGMTVVSPADVIDALPKDNSDVELEIASNGGEVVPATEIYTALKNYHGNVTAQIVANAYSAGTIIAMGADKVQMSPGAQMMIHNAASGADGNYHDMDQASQMLQSTNKAIANMYAVKTGKPVQTFLDLMDSTTWMDADKAIELGLADELVDFTPVTNSFNTSLVPYQALNKIKNLIAKNKQLENNNNNGQLSEHEKLVQAKLAIFNKGDF